jgi:hypothetical protein
MLLNSCVIQLPLLLNKHANRLLKLSKKPLAWLSRILELARWFPFSFKFEQQNSSFIDMMEKYYDQSHEAKMKDVRPELSYQLGATPEFTEVPRFEYSVLLISL